MVSLLFALSLALSPGSGPHFNPAQPDVTTCNCQPINGTCDGNCMTVCSTGFLDCDGNVANGCEADLSNPSTCGACDNDCNRCLIAPTCTAGACGGSTYRHDGTACQADVSCTTSGVCQAGSCQCAANNDLGGPTLTLITAPPDMSLVSGGRDVPGSCDFGAGSSSASTLLFAVVAALLLARRRRRRA